MPNKGGINDVKTYFDALDEVVANMYGGDVEGIVKSPYHNNQRKVTISWIVGNFKVVEARANEILDDYLNISPETLSDDLLNRFGVFDK